MVLERPAFGGPLEATSVQLPVGSQTKLRGPLSDLVGHVPCVVSAVADRMLPSTTHTFARML
jgi:hypothetical protein